MASGILGQSALTANTNTTVYTVPAAKTATVTISICNTTASPAYVRVALAATGTPSAAEWVEYDTEIMAKSTFERTGFVMDTTKRLVVFSDTANVAVSAFGFEE